jgi:hypothetical protein
VISAAKFEALKAEYSEVERRLRSHAELNVTVVPGRSLWVGLAVIPPARTKRATITVAHRAEIYAKPNDDDAALCGTVINDVLTGLHFVCKKCYRQPPYLVYYLNPDWPYWHTP